MCFVTAGGATGALVALVLLTYCAALESGAVNPIPSPLRERNAVSASRRLAVEVTSAATDQ